jgi:hypothetical protein
MPSAPPRSGPVVFPTATVLAALVLSTTASGVENPKTPGFESVARPTRTINKVMGWLLAEVDGKPAPYCDDAAFLRRASLDVIGRIATVEEYDRYFQDPPQTRRGLLVERLLRQPEYARFWAQRWAVWLTQVTDAISPEAARRAPTYRRGLARWLEKELGAEKASYKATVERLLTATGSPEENGAVNFVLANLGNRLPVREEDEGKFDSTPLTNQTGELFLGLNLVCAQCHDHPYDAHVHHRDYWALDACFRQIDVDGDRLSDNLEQNRSGIILFENRNSVFGGATPKLVGDATQKIPARGKIPRRQELARRLTAHSNFGPAFVDRMWGEFLGARIAHNSAVFSEYIDPSNDETESELLLWLAQAFTAAGQDDPRNFIRWVCASDAYNRTAVREAVEEERSPLLRTEEFQRQVLRGLPTDAYIDSLLTALRPKVAATEAERTALRERFAFLAGQIDETGATPLAPLFLLNNPQFQELLDPEASTTLKTAQRLSRDNPRAGVDYLYRAAFNRSCTDDEFREVRKLVGADADLQDLFWALLNSSEFALKH